MKLIKKDAKYEYYELDGDDQHDYKYYSSYIVAIKKSELYHTGLVWCLLNGYALPCNYSYLPNKNPLDWYIVDTNSIKIDNEYLKMEMSESGKESD